jgi:general secretion pathway protein D
MRLRINLERMACLWVFMSCVQSAGGQQSPADAGVKPWLQQAIGELSRLPAGGTVKVASRRIALSYIDPLRATQMLALHGYTIGKADAVIDPAALPVVIALPGTTFHETIPKVEEKFPQTETDPLNELVVFHNENEPSQLGGVLEILSNEIDKPARQIIIEAMILEVSSTALSELGVKWTRADSAPQNGNFINSQLDGLTIGSLAYPGAGEALSLVTKAGQGGVFRNLNAQIKALVREGAAEVLSRPSVLALNNRMAYINVSEEIPVPNTSYSPLGNYASTSFTDKKAGITLALRPRIDSVGDEVSMQVNAEVSARVPDADVIVRNASGVVLARSPTISKRDIRTYVRVANNTPFIIGGLIAKDKQTSIDKMPLLGSVPFLGRLFQSKRVSVVKREVIIVLTPFVLPEGHVIGKNMPMDEDAFDSVGHQLFRDAYRIRSEDTFDLSYLYENRELQRMKAEIADAVSKDMQLAKEYPYSNFYGDAVPGESILCYRQIYEVLKRRNLQKDLDVEKIIFFEEDRKIGSGYRVRFLEEYIKAQVPGILTDKGGMKAIALSFNMQRASGNAASIFSEPVPEVSLLDCANKEEWSRELWEMNQATEDGQERFTVLLRNKKDVTRLKYALLMKKTVELNTERIALSLRNFTRGRLLLMPRVKVKDIELIDGDVARAFFYSEMYYQAQQVKMREDIDALRRLNNGKRNVNRPESFSPRN